MKRTKETITNRRLMHRYQELYKLRRYKILVKPLLNIPANLKWNQTEWLKYSNYFIKRQIKYNAKDRL